MCVTVSESDESERAVTVMSGSRMQMYTPPRVEWEGGPVTLGGAATTTPAPALGLPGVLPAHADDARRHQSQVSLLLGFIRGFP